MTVVTPTDRPESVRNRCVIKVFGGVFILSHCFFYFSVGVGAFVIELSQISSFFSLIIMLDFAKIVGDCSKHLRCQFRLHLNSGIILKWRKGAY